MGRRPSSIRLLLPSRSPLHTQSPPPRLPPSVAGERRRQFTTMPSAAAARAFFSSHPEPPLLRAGPGPRIAAVSFPRRSLPAVALSLSVSAPGPAPPAANPKYHNAKVDAGEEDVNGDELLRRFTREVARAGVMHEVRRRRRHEDARDKRKRKSRDAAWRNRRRRFRGPYPFDEEQEPKEGTTDDDRHDNWEIPGGEL